MRWTRTRSPRPFPKSERSRHQPLERPLIGACGQQEGRRFIAQHGRLVEAAYSRSNVDRLRGNYRRRLPVSPSVRSRCWRKQAGSAQVSAWELVSVAMDWPQTDPSSHTAATRPPSTTGADELAPKAVFRLSATGGRMERISHHFVQSDRQSRYVSLNRSQPCRRIVNCCSASLLDCSQIPGSRKGGGVRRTAKKAAFRRQNPPCLCEFSHSRNRQSFDP